MLYPLPAVMVSVTDGEGNDNIITIAWAGTVCTNPPMVSISVRPSRYSYEMIFNLADNAVKYGKTDGHVRIMLSEDDNERRIEVEDDGNGIPKEDQGRIFERFYRVDKSHSRRNEGTGLGLSIVKRAAMFFGGNVSVKSEIGVGTSFKVVIPRSKNKA